MSITLNQFRTASLQNTGKLTVTNDNQVQTKGTGLGRLVEWFRGKTEDGRSAKRLENTQAKASFLTAIREEFGDAMAKQADHEMGKHSSLKTRTVRVLLKHAEEHRETFTKQHNAPHIAVIRRDIQTALEKHGGVQSLYEDKSGNQFQTVEGMFKAQVGLSLPSFDSETAEIFKQAFLEKQSNSGVVTNGLMGKKTSFTLSELRQAISESAVKNLWLNKGGLSESQMNEVLNKEPVDTRHVTKLFLTAANAIEFKPECRDTILENLKTFFTKAHEKGLHSAMEAMVLTGINKGLLSPETPGVAESYEKSSAKFTGGEKVKHLCFAEKCYVAAGRQEDAARIRKLIAEAQKQHVSLASGKNIDLIKLPSCEEDRRSLLNIRNGLNTSFTETSLKLRHFISGIYKECLSEFGVNEKDQSLVMFGSGSRDEMFPFSDLEFAVLTKSKEGNEKLHQAITLFEMRITALGETPQGPDKSIPIREGLCFDPGGNCPKGNERSFIGPPSEILTKLGGDLILVEVFSSAKVLVGSDELSKQYNEGVERHFQSKSEFSERSKGQQFAIDNLADHTKGLRDNGHPITLTDRSNLQQVDAKKLTRFPYMLASSLCKLHGVSPGVTNTVERLNVLHEMGVLTRKEKTALVEAFNGFGNLRLKAELHYQGQTHAIKKNDDGHSLSLPENEWHQMLNLLEPLHDIFLKAERFAKNPQSGFANS